MNKILFMGTAKFSADILMHLIENNYNVVAAVSQPDKPFGRKREIKRTEVANICDSYNIKVFQPENIKKDYSLLKTVDFDVIISAAYGQIVPQEVLDMPSIIAINVHGSLLPKYRGASPIQYSLLNGDSITGITIMEMVKKMDAGDIIHQEELQIEEEDNTLTLFNKLTKTATIALDKSLENIFNNDFTKIKQDENYVSYCPMISKDMEHITFDDSVDNVFNKIRSLAPNPGGYFIFNNKRYKMIRITRNYDTSIVNTISKINKEGIEIGCIDGNIIIKEIKAEGKKVMNIEQFVNGNSELSIGDYLN